MASITDDPNGRKRIQFFNADNERKTIRIGKATSKQAEAFKVKIEQLVTASISGAMDDETSRWLAGIGDKLHKKLAKAGLIHARGRTAATLGAYMVQYFESLDVKPATATHYGHTRRYLINFFGENRPLRSIEPMDGDKWRQHLKAAGLSDPTIARRVTLARQMFKRAMKWKLVSENPFTDVKAGSQTNKARQFYVTQAMAQQVLDSCPDIEWRLLFALSRYGGLRCPSEHVALKWLDVDWEHSRIRVPSSKTERHEGKDHRYIPIFPELRPYLLEAFEAAEPGAEHVIARYRDTSANLRTQFNRIIRRAGLSPWPKLFHNLRGTRQTELEERFPSHVVCAWIGNSKSVAEKHYLQLTEAHFAAAITGEEKAAQIPAQHTSAQPCTAVQTASAEVKKPLDLQGGASECSAVPNDRVGPTSPEHFANSLGKSGASQQSVSPGGALADDPRLQHVIGAWADLSESARAEVMLIVERGQQK